MNRPPAPTRLALTVLAALAAGCTLGEAHAEKSKEAPPPAGFDWSRPDAPVLALRTGAAEAAARLGSFEWAGTAGWLVERPGDDAKRVAAFERHQLRQLATGEFQVGSEIDSGRGEGSQAGREVIWVDGMTYARGRWAPWRERPTDRGRDARRFRDESFGLAADLERLSGGALQLVPAGEAKHLGRRARRFTVGAGPRADPAAPAAPPVFAAGGPDEDTRRRLAFLETAKLVRAQGQVLADEETGVPLLVDLRLVFEMAGAEPARAEVSTAAQVKALGGAVVAVARPQGSLPDDRKPKGVARALEAAGLKKEREKKEAAEPADEAGAEAE